MPYSSMEWAGDVSPSDYKGEINFEFDDTEMTPSLNEMLGLDRDRWSIIGINASPESGRNLVEEDEYDDTIRIYAVDRTRANETLNQPGGLYNDTENVEVVEFYLHDLNMEDILKCFKRVSFSATLPGLEHSRFKVAGRADIPVQADEY